MFTVNPLPPQLDADLLALLARAEPASIGHDQVTGFMEPGMKAMQQGMRAAGTAVTIQQPGMDGSMLSYAMGKLRRGDILVIDRCGEMRHASFGGMIVYAAKCAGIAGIIIDGMVTDIGEIREYGVPVWARGLSAITTRRLLRDGSFCVPIQCGGVVVRPGDAIIADECGIVVLAPGEAEAAARRAIARQEAEVDTRRRLAAGERLTDMSDITRTIDALATGQSGA